MSAAKKNKYRYLEIELMRPNVACDMPPEPASTSKPPAPPVEPVVPPPPVPPPPSIPPSPPSTPSSPPASTFATPSTSAASRGVTMVTEPVTETIADTTSSFRTPPPEPKSSRKTLILVLVTIFIALSIPLVVFVAQQRQDIRQRASVAEPCYICNTRDICEDTGLHPPECTSSLNECGTLGASCGGGNACTPGTTLSPITCTTSENCPGTKNRLCNSSNQIVYGPCDDVPNDNCPAQNTPVECKTCNSNSNCITIRSEPACDPDYNLCETNNDCSGGGGQSDPSPSPVANFGWDGSCFTSVPLGNGCFAVRYICRNRDASGQCNDTSDPDYKVYQNPGDGNPCFATNICGTQQIDIARSCAFTPNVCPIDHPTLCDFKSTNTYPDGQACTNLPQVSPSPGLGTCGISCTDTSQCQSGLQCTTWEQNPVCWGAACDTSNPSPSPIAQCQNLKIYSVSGNINMAANWQLLPATELPQLRSGDTIYITSQGTGTNGGIINRARIRVSTGGSNPPPFTTNHETPNVKPKLLASDPDEYYIQYTIPTTLPAPPTFTFSAEVCVLNAGGVCQWF